MVHPFLEGNTRTIAVFLALYLRSMAFNVNNEPFHRHASFFRSSLVWLPIRIAHSTWSYTLSRS